MPNRKLHRIFAAVVSCALGLTAGLSYAEDIEGSWKLQSYTLNGKSIDVSGILVLNDGAFGMIYTMGSVPETLSGRAHAGTFDVEQNRLTFDVQWWIQKVDNVASRIPPKTAGARIEWQNDKLVLHFDGGSIQALQRLESQGDLIKPGHWMLQSIRTGNESKAASGLLVAADDHYVLVYIDDAGNGQAYGGVGRDSGQDRDLKVLWNLQLDGERGSAFAGAELQDLELQQSRELLEIRDDGGSILSFEQ